MPDRRTYQRRGISSLQRANEVRAREDLRRRALAAIVNAGDAGILSEDLHDTLRTRFPRQGMRDNAIGRLRAEGLIANGGRADAGHGVRWVATDAGREQARAKAA